MLNAFRFSSSLVSIFTSSFKIKRALGGSSNNVAD